MRLPLATALLLTASTAFAQVKVVGELSVPAAPAVSGASALGAAFTALPPSLPLAASSLTPSPSLSPAPAPVAAPIAVLAQTGTALAAPSKEDPASVSRRTFDATEPYGEGVSLPDAVGKGPAAHPSTPVALERFDASRFLKPVQSPVRTAAWETVEVGALAIPIAFASMFARGAFTDPVLLTGAMLALWTLAFFAMRAHLASLRSTVVGGWQASHDQKYRTDPATGQLKDIRGHKYGSDRYEEYAKGSVGRTATALIAGAAAAGAAAFLLL